MVKFYIICEKGGERLKTKTLSFLSKFRYELSAFLLLCIQACMNIDFRQGMDRNYYSYYLADFSMGKTSRLLIGSFVNLLTDNPTVTWINCFAAVVLLLTFIFTSLLIGKVIKSTDSEIRPVITVFSLFFVSGAFTLWGFSKFFGMLDIYMYLFTVISVIAAKNNMLRWFIPLFCVGGVLINYVFTISYYPLIALVLLYLIAASEKKAVNIVVLLASGVISVALMFYCVIIGKTTATMSFEEMWQIMENKIGIELDYENVTYYEFYLFGTDEHSVKYGADLNASVSEFAGAFFRFLVEDAFDSDALVSVAIGTLPILIAFWMIWAKCFKNAETKFKKFVYLCFMISPVFIVVCCLLSTDIPRWAAPGIITQFVLGYFMFAIKDKPFEEAVLVLKSKLKGKAFVVVMLWAVYASFFALYTLTG